MKNKIAFLVLSIFFLQLPLLSLAQFNGEKFGKNRIQHKNGFKTQTFSAVCGRSG